MGLISAFGNPPPAKVGDVLVQKDILENIPNYGVDLLGQRLTVTKIRSQYLIAETKQGLEIPFRGTDLWTIDRIERCTTSTAS